MMHLACPIRRVGWALGGQEGGVGECGGFGSRVAAGPGSSCVCAVTRCCCTGLGLRSFAALRIPANQSSLHSLYRKSESQLKGSKGTWGRVLRRVAIGGLAAGDLAGFPALRTL